MSYDYLRRCDRSRMTKEEFLISIVNEEIERMGCDVRLSAAQHHLHLASVSLANYVDGVPDEAAL